MLLRKDDVTLKVLRSLTCGHESQQNSFSESLGWKFCLFLTLYTTTFFMSGIWMHLFSTARSGKGGCVTCGCICCMLSLKLCHLYADLERMGSTGRPTVRPACVLSVRRHVSILWLWHADLGCNNSGAEEVLAGWCTEAKSLFLPARQLVTHQPGCFLSPSSDAELSVPRWHLCYHPRRLHSSQGEHLNINPWIHVK